MASASFRFFTDLVKKGRYPRATKWVWQRFYNLLSRFWTDQTWRFMNYGYIPGPDRPQFQLQGSDEADRPFIGLYHQALAGLDTEGLRILEVGSGRGGGSSYVARYFNPGEMVGVDYSSATVKRARKVIPQETNLRFEKGDAENLPFPDGSFDIVINIESSHCYGNLDKFFSEVARVLKPGGLFSWADLRAPDMMEQLAQAFEHPDLHLEEEYPLTDGVLRALDAMHERKVARISKVPLVSPLLLEFAATEGSAIYRGLKGGHVQYLSRRYRKSASSNA